MAARFGKTAIRAYKRPAAKRARLGETARGFLYSLYRILQSRARKTFKIFRKRAMQNMESAKRSRR